MPLGGGGGDARRWAAVFAAAFVAAVALAPSAFAAARTCGAAAAPTRALAWRAYVPPGTPVRRRLAAVAGARPAVTVVPAWRLVLRTARTPGGTCFARVRLGRRPNGADAWVAVARVRVRATRWRVEVDRARRRAVLLHAGRAVGRWRVVVGKPATPTPRGLFAIAASYRTPASSFEGRWILTLTAHSDVLPSFAGGDGQVALHGRGGAALRDPLGTAASHGCVRMDDGAIVRRVGRTRLPGVPVSVR